MLQDCKMGAGGGGGGGSGGQISKANSYIVIIFPKLGETKSEAMFFSNIRDAYNYKQEILTPDNSDRIHITKKVDAAVIEI